MNISVSPPPMERQSPPLFGREHALFLDFDGTLVDLAARPDQVRPAPELVPLLSACEAHLGGALALLTGRRVETMDTFLAPRRFAAAGLHGVQRRETAEGLICVDQAASTGIGARLAQLAAPHPGLWVEDKGPAVALHYRDVPELASLAAELVRTAIGFHEGLEIIPGKRVFEARPRGFDKGKALTAFLAAPPFAGRIPVFAGDDHTDEDAIAAVQSLGGIGIKVGPGRSAARHALLDPQAVLLWLTASLQSLDAARTPAMAAV